jgi:hypothetical protein
MKKYKYLILILITSLTLSCDENYLDVVPDNVATIDNAFSDRFNAQKFLYTIYSAIPGPGNVVENPALNGADEIWYPEDLENRAGVRIAQGFQSAVNASGDKWTGNSVKDLYVAIRNCNIFLNKIDDVLGMDEYEKKQWKGEAKFLKAYFHFYLLKMYGPIVISDELIPVNESSKNIEPVRVNVDDAFAYIVTLIDEAIVDLPNMLQFEADDLGRITKPIAAAIKARVLITQASPLFNGNTVYSNFVDANGENLFPTIYDENKWQLAAIATKEAIDLCEAVGVRLYQKEDYVNPFPQSDVTMLKSALRNRITKKWNSELIWGHTEDTWYTEVESMPRLYNYTTNPVNSRHCATMRIAEMYYSKNGVPISEDITYDYENRFRLKVAEDADKYHVEVGEETAILNFDRETRFYADLSFDRGVWFGNGKEVTDEDPWHVHARGGEFASVFERSAYSVTGYWPKKLVSIESQVKNGTSFSPKRYAFPIIRLADLYLYYAEALNEVKGVPDTEVYEYLDKVRERAGLESVVNSWNAYSRDPSKPTTKEGLRKIIQQERMIEMAFEGGRFWDTRRWKTAKGLMNKPIKGWNVLEHEASDYYAVRTLYNPTFSERDYLWPIPESEIINTPSLIQNPGW